MDTQQTVDVVREVRNRFNLNPRQIFKDAFQHAAHNVSDERLNEHFLNWHNHQVLHEEVEEYCLYILAGRIVPCTR